MGNKKAIAFKVNYEVYIKYKNLDIDSKHTLVKLIQQVIEQYAAQAPANLLQNNININININKVENNVKVEGLERIFHLIQRLYYLRDPLPPLQRSLIEEAVKEAKKLLVK